MIRCEMPISSAIAFLDFIGWYQPVKTLLGIPVSEDGRVGLNRRVTTGTIFGPLVITGAHRICNAEAGDRHPYGPP